MPLGSPVQRKETLARFVVFSDQVRKSGEAKVDLFLPDPSRTVSVFRIDGLSKARIKDMNNAVDMARRKKLVNYGYCPSNAGQVVDRGFTLDPNDEPKHHVNIGGFGSDPAEDRAKAIRLVQIAGKLRADHLQ